MKRRLNVLRKDLRLFFRDRRTLLLVILTPIIIMFILGNVFSQKERKEFLQNIKIGYCNSDENFNLTYAFNIVSFEDDCENNTKALVKKGELRAALIVPKDFSQKIKEGYGSSLTLYLDNAKSHVAFTVSTSVEAMINKMNEDIGTRFIEDAWKNLRDLNVKLKFVVRNLESSKETSLAIQQKTENMTRLLEKINISAARDFVRKANESVGPLEQSLNISQLQIDDTGLLDFTEEAEISKNIVLDTIGLQIKAANDTKSALEAIYQNNCTSNETMLCGNLSSSIADLKSSIDYLQLQKTSISQSLDSVKSQSNLSISTINAYKEAVNNLTKIINDTQKNISDVKEVIRLMNDHVTIVENTKQEADAQVKELHETVVNFTQQVIDLQNDLNRTSILLDEYTSRDPKNIVRAIALDSKESFLEKNSFVFMAPGVMLTVLLLISFLVSSSNVVDERKNATMMRNILAPISLGNFLYQKIMYFVMLSFIQFALMLLVVAYFGVVYPISFEFVLAAFIVSIVFSSMGLFIGTLARSENIALLISLVLAIPMMFLSGVFFPFESMPKLMNTIGFYSPLTLAINSFDRILVYNTGIDAKLLLMLIGISLIFFLLSILSIKKKPTIE